MRPFNPGWKLTLLSATLFPGLIALGCWQLSRAHGKQALLDQIALRRHMPAVEFAALGDLAEPAYTQLLVRGEYLEGRVLLRDNQMYRGRFGYEWLQLFQLQDGNVNSGENRSKSPPLLLLSRGWVAGSLDRSVLPPPPPVSGHVELVAEVYVPPGKAFLLKHEALPAGWPKRVQSVDVAALSADLSAELYPHVLRVHSGDHAGFAPYWQDINVQPEKHSAYAVQWFAMAVALVAMYLAAGLGFLSSGGAARDD